MPLSAGSRLGHYEIAALIGAGGMGEVYRARDPRLQREVAIKILPAHLTDDASARDRLRREALSAAALDHPFICKVYEIGESGGGLFIVMEFIEGQTLEAAARRDLLPLRQVVEIANELTQALEEAHRRGVVHRDLKPSNVMMTPQGHVKVMDFGLAKLAIEVATADTPSGAATVLTGAGTRLGTPAYMSPEQVLGNALDSRSDIFSLGIMLCELTTGTHPFMRADLSETMAAILRDPPSSGRRLLNSVHGFEALVRCMLAKPIAERVQTMSEVRVELEAVRERVWQAASIAASSQVDSGPAIEQTPLVGRDAESTELRRLLDRMLAGHGAFALIGGEPGVGKTRLARELTNNAHERGCLCLTGRCFEMEGTPPFAPFIESVEEAVRAVPQAVRRALGEVAAEIASIVPSLRRAYTDIPPSPEVPPDQQRRLVFAAYLEYLRRAAGTSPIVVLFDDLHWADDSTLQLISHLAPHLSSMRVLAIGTYRDVELDVKRPFAKTLEGLVRQRFATRINLRRLSESGVQNMLSAMGGSAPPSALTKVVFRETEGNPFFVEEVYHHLAEEGKLFDEGGRWKTDLRVDTIEVPEGVRLVVGRRLERLGERAYKILTAAAVIGRTFPLDLLGAIVDASQDEVLDAVEDAERAQLISSQPGVREARYEFAHELIRSTLAGAQSLPRRQRLHLRIADALERLRAASLDSHASVLAHHLYQAGAAVDSQRTASFLARAGRRAIATGAFEEALETFDLLISLELPDEDPLLAEAWEGRGKSLEGLHRRDESIVALEQALARHIARHDDPGIARAGVLLGGLRVWAGNIPGALAVVNQMLSVLSEGAEVERTFVQAALALWSAVFGRYDDASRHIDEALSAAERINQPELLERVFLAHAYIQRSFLRLEGASESGRRALSLLRPEALWDRADVMWNLAFTELYRGRFAEVDALLPELENVGRRAGQPGAILIGENCCMILELARTGDLRAFLVSCERASSGPMTIITAMFRTSAALAHFHLGHVDHGLAELESALGHAPPMARGLVESLTFVASAFAGRAQEARQVLDRVKPFLPVAGRRNDGAAWTALEAVIGLALLGETNQCGALYPAAKGWVDTGAIVSPIAPLAGPQLVAGVAAHAAALPDTAREHFETALRQARELPLRLLQPSAQYWYGRMLLDEPQPAEQLRGRAMIEAAATDFRSLEMVTYANLAESLLRES